LAGEYETVLAGISPSAREASVPMKFRSNYYRVQALSILVMSYDKDPPAVPRDFTGYIDTLGLVHLSWTTSNEVDLDGYYLFKGFEEELEKAMITAIPLKGPTHIDTVSMVNPTEIIYYQLRSVDTRGNSSNFTPVLALKKPDVYPPTQPQFDKAISLAWVRSPSSDVMSYSLFRRIVGEDDFSLVREWPADAPRQYLDSLVQADIDYEYITTTGWYPWPVNPLRFGFGPTASAHPSRTSTFLATPKSEPSPSTGLTISLLVSSTYTVGNKMNPFLCSKYWPVGAAPL